MIKYIIIISIMLQNISANEDKWVLPSKSTCIKNGGDLKRKGCYASVYNGKKICKAIDAEIPVLDEYKQVIKSCGISLHIIKEDERYPHRDALARNNNVANASYQSCMHKLGFTERTYVYKVKYPKGYSGEINLYTATVLIKKPTNKDILGLWTDDTLGYVACIKK